MTKVQLQEVKIEHGEGGEVTLHITVPAQQVQKSRKKVLRDYARRVKIPGFRPGHAPIGIMRRTVGDTNIAQALSDELVPAAYQEAIDSEKLEPLVRAEIDKLEFDAFDTSADMSFDAVLILRPEVTLPDVAEVTVERKVDSVEDDDIEHEIEHILEGQATFENVEGRGAQHHDILRGELTVVVDGKKRSEEPEILPPFTLGHSDSNPPIDEHLEGMKLDEERTFTLTYPEDFEDKELAGKEGEFTVKVTSIKERIIPELDEKLAKDNGFDNIDALRDAVRGMIANRNENNAQDEVRKQVLSAVSEGATLEVPQKLVERRAEDRKKQHEERLKRSETTLEDFLKDAEQTQEEWEAELKEEEGKSLREDLVLDAVAKREELQVTTDELEDYFVNLAQALQQPVEEVVKRFDVQAVHASLLRGKAVSWLVEHANITGDVADENEEDSAEAEDSEKAEETVATE